MDSHVQQVVRVKRDKLAVYTNSMSLSFDSAISPLEIYLNRNTFT